MKMTRRSQFAFLAVTCLSVFGLVRADGSGRCWTRQTTRSDYDESGCLVTIETTESSDYGLVTNSVVKKDFLGRVSEVITPLSETVFVYDRGTPRILSSTERKTNRTTTYLYNARGEQIGTETDGVRSLREISYVWMGGAQYLLTTETVSAGAKTNGVSQTFERLTGLSNDLRRETIKAENGVIVSVTSNYFDAASSVLTSVCRSDTEGVTVTKSQYGRIIEQSRFGETLYNFFDSYGRVFYTERRADDETRPRSGTWTGRNDFGDVVEEDVFKSSSSSEIVATFYKFDEFGNVVGITNAVGGVERLTYDSVNRLIAVDGSRHSARWTYDTADRKTSLSTTLDGTTWYTTRWAYDPRTGLCMSKTYPGGTSVLYAYTPDGRPLRTTHPNGAWQENVYDESCRLVAVDSSDGTTDFFFYDEFAQEIAFSNGVSSVALMLDAHGFPTTEVVSVGDETKTIVRRCDDWGRTIALDETACSYAEHGRYGTISNADACATYRYLPGRHEVGYDIRLSNGKVFSRLLRRDLYRPSLVTAITNRFNSMPVDVDLTYAFDDLSRPLRRNDDTFGYNARGEVVSANVLSNEVSYAYDESGNRTGVSNAGEATLYTANGLNQYASVNDASGGRQFTYDSNGNLVSDGRFTYAYDAANRLTTVSSNGIVISSYDYDAKSRRVRKTTSSTTHVFFYDDWNLIEERIVSTNGTRRVIQYVWGHDLSGTAQGAGGIGGLLWLKCDGVIYIPTYDNNGNITAYIDADGNMVASYAYDAFGCVVARSGSLVETFPHRFSTKYLDSETGLYYYGYRFYSPMLGRWLNRDPIGEDGGENLYRFVDNNPNTKYDPNGHIPLDAIWDIGNIIYDIYVDDEVALAADVAALMVPYLPAGSTKLVKAANLSDVTRICGQPSRIGVTYKYLEYGDKHFKLKNGLKNNANWVRDTLSGAAQFRPGFSHADGKSLVDKALQVAKRLGKVKPKDLNGFVYDTKEAIGAAAGKVTTRIQLYVTPQGEIHIRPKEFR